MAAININRNNDDQFYRYKMPRLIAKVEGKGNGIKTVIVNMAEIGKSLQRPASYPCKYFGCEIGAQTQMDPKNGRYIVNGAHEEVRLQELLDGFIKNFVLCEQCDNPETLLTVGKTKIRQQCQACGYSRIITNKHKLTTYILKNPPTAEESAALSTGKKEGKKGRGKDKKSKRDKEPSSPSDVGDHTHNSDEDFESMETNGHHNGGSGEGEGDEEEEWSMDTSKAAVKARMENLTDTANALALNDDLDKSPQERLDLFFKFVETIKKEGGIPGVARSLQKVKAEAERLDVMDTAAGIMAEHLYTDKLLEEVTQYRSIMLHFVVDNKKAQRTLLDAFEILVGKVYPELIVKTPHVLKAFYDQDILEEDVILEWNDKISKKRVSKTKAKEIRDKAKPIVDWLRTAEEESSEEEEDIEVVYSNQAPAQLTVVKPVTPPPEGKGACHSPQEPGKEEEFDIDAI